jgi:hypothetical protein
MQQTKQEKKRLDFQRETGADSHDYQPEAHAQKKHQDGIVRRAGARADQKPVPVAEVNRHADPKQRAVVQHPPARADSHAVQVQGQAKAVFDEFLKRKTRGQNSHRAMILLKSGLASFVVQATRVLKRVYFHRWLVNGNGGW